MRRFMYLPTSKQSREDGTFEALTWVYYLPNPAFCDTYHRVRVNVSVSRESRNAWDDKVISQIMRLGRYPAVVGVEGLRRWREADTFPKRKLMRLTAKVFGP